jgi:hypothetical protein
LGKGRRGGPLNRGADGKQRKDRGGADEAGRHGEVSGAVGLRLR